MNHYTAVIQANRQQTDPDVPVGLSQSSLPELGGAKGVQEAHVEVVEVGFDGGSFHDQILCHPVVVALLDQAAKLLRLSRGRE